MLRYHHAHSQTHHFISVIFICKYAAPPTEHLRDCGPQNSQVSLFPISGEIFQHFSSFGSTMKKEKENSTDNPSTCLMRCCLLTHCNEKRWSAAMRDHLTQLYFLSHLLCLYRKWEYCCLCYEVWVTLCKSISLHWRQTKLVTQFRHDIFYRQIKGGKKKAT